MNDKIEKPVSQFGLLSDAINVLRACERNVGVASGIVNNLLSAAESGEISRIPQAELVRLLDTVRSALNAVRY